MQKKCERKNCVKGWCKSCKSILIAFGCKTPLYWWIHLGVPPGAHHYIAMWCNVRWFPTFEINHHLRNSNDTSKRNCRWALDAFSGWDRCHPNAAPYPSALCGGRTSDGTPQWCHRLQRAWWQRRKWSEKPWRVWLRIWPKPFHLVENHWYPMVMDKICKMAGKNHGKHGIPGDPLQPFAVHGVILPSQETS